MILVGPIFHGEIARFRENLKTKTFKTFEYTLECDQFSISLNFTPTQ